jgi:hypothetical protein
MKYSSVVDFLIEERYEDIGFENNLHYVVTKVGHGHQS